MPKIEIHDFGPIKAGSLDVSRVTVFVGNQGSGKSTVAKLISTFLWMEKVLVRGDYTKDHLTAENFIAERLSYHRLSGYSKSATKLIYEGMVYRFAYENDKLHIDELNTAHYILPHIMYVPAERGIVASVGNAAKLKNISGALSEFITEYGYAREALSDSVKLPINETSAEYDRTSGTIYICGNDYRVSLADAASGFQSLVPLYLVSQYLCNSVKSVKSSGSMSSDEKRRFEKQLEEIAGDPNLNEEQKRIARSSLGKKYNKAAFVNIVEEPELNLSPNAQKRFLYELLKLNNAVRKNETDAQNKVIITTHSPYLMNFLSISIHGKALSEKINSFGKTELLKELSAIVPLGALTANDDVSIYQLDETKGHISKLPSPHGIPSDDNFLNNMLGQGNDEFDALLEIEEKLEC